MVKLLKNNTPRNPSTFVIFPLGPAFSTFFGGGEGGGGSTAWNMLLRRWLVGTAARRGQGSGVEAGGDAGFMPLALQLLEGVTVPGKTQTPFSCGADISCERLGRRWRKESGLESNGRALLQLWGPGFDVFGVWASKQDSFKT